MLINDDLLARFFGKKEPLRGALREAARKRFCREGREGREGREFRIGLGFLQARSKGELVADVPSAAVVKQQG